MMKLRCTWCWKGRRERGMNRGRCRGRERRGRGERGREIHRGGERKVWSRGWERWRLQPRLSRHSTAMMKPWLLPLLSPLRYFIYLLIIIHTQKIIEIQGMIHRGNKMCRERVKRLMRERERRGLFGAHFRPLRNNGKTAGFSERKWEVESNSVGD